MRKAIFKSPYWWKGRRFRPSRFPQEVPDDMPLPRTAEETDAPVEREAPAKPQPVALSELAKQRDSEAAPPEAAEEVLAKKAK